MWYSFIYSYETNTYVSMINNNNMNMSRYFHCSTVYKKAKIDLQWLHICRESSNQIFNNYFQKGCKYWPITIFKIKTGKLQYRNTVRIIKEFILFPHYFKSIPLVRASTLCIQMIPHPWLVVSVSASHTVSREFASRPGHTKHHHKNGTNCIREWHAVR